MNSKLLSMFSIMLLLFAAGAEAQQLPPEGYQLKWGDEFNSQSIDSNMWGTGMKPWGTTDNSPCLITPEDSYLENGDLVLRERRGTFGTYKYSCGWAYTKKWFKYGYFEMRAQYPAGRGQWPAWWMLKQGWPPEIDIAEYRGTPLNYMTEAFYWGSWSTSLLNESSGWDFTKWHTYALNWGPGYLIWYVDGKVKKYYNGSQVPSDSMYVIFSAGLDGSSADSTTGFPNYYKIDYFRVYQDTAAGTCFPTPVIPNVQINFGAWQMTDTVYAKKGQYITLAPLPSSGGTWFWSGGGLSGSANSKYITAQKSDTITAKFVNACGDTSSLNFYIMVDITAVDKANDSPHEFNLSQNYPNPFNPSTEISYDLPQGANVVIDIYDLLGRKINSLVNSYELAGHHLVEWNSKDNRGNSLPSGTYIYRIVVKNNQGVWSDVKKMVLLK